MAAFLRKRDLRKTTNPSSTDPEPTPPTPSLDNFQTSMQKLATLQNTLADTPLQTWERESAQAIGYLLDSRSTLLVSQQLAAYRESLLLMGRCQLELKKKGQEFSEQVGSLVGIFMKVLEQLCQITEDNRHDQVVQESGLPPILLLVLDAFVVSLQTQASKTEKRPTLMRKNSLKKVDELAPLRPSSRGKLSSLSKRSDLETPKQQLLKDISRPKPETPSDTPIESLCLHLCSLFKNLSANARLRRELLTPDYLRTINRYLCVWGQKNLTPLGNKLLNLLCAGYRHLAVEQKSHRHFLESNSLDGWCRLIELYPTNQQLMFNLLRTLSKLSNYESCCVKLSERQTCIARLGSFFKYYKAHIHIVIRVAIVFANMTSYLADLRNQLYFNCKVWPDVYDCFSYYAGRELSGRGEADKLGLSMAAWDFQHIKKETDIDCTIRIVRLVANLFTVPAIGQDIYLNDAASYRELTRKLKSILQKKTNLEKSSELIATILSCLTNVLYYDREVLMASPEHRMVKVQLVGVLVDFIVQIDHQQVTCESLRVLANLTRQREFCAVVVEAKLHEALLILLDSTSKEIVFYCLGVLSNLLTDGAFKQQYKEPIITGVISILNECDNEDFDVATLALKTLACIVDARNENLDPKLLAEVESCLMNLGGHCDRLIANVPASETQELHESRSLINSLLNNMPEEKFICPVKNCGRKFADQPKLQEHVKRRHKQ